MLQLAKECPGLQVSITLGELVEAIQYAIAETKRELEQEIADSKAETYISREKVMEITGKSSTTIWRWQKLNYLVPVSSVVKMPPEFPRAFPDPSVILKSTPFNGSLSVPSIYLCTTRVLRGES